MAETSTAPMTDEDYQKAVAAAVAGGNSMNHAGIPKVNYSGSGVTDANAMVKPTSPIPHVNDLGPAPAVTAQPAAPAPMGAVAPAGIPDLRKPTNQESHAAGKAEYEAGRPQVTAPPETKEYSQQKQEQLDYDKLHPWGSDISAHPGTGGKIAHVLGRIGNVAGDILAPGLMEGIPGTDMNNRYERKVNQNEYTSGIENLQREAATNALDTKNQLVPFTDERGITSMIPYGSYGPAEASAERARASEQDAAGHDTTRLQQQQLKGAQAIAAMAGRAPTTEQDKRWAQDATQKNDTGNLGIADRQRLAGIQRSEKISGVPPELVAQIGPPPVPADFAKGSQDPAYLKSAQLWGAQLEAGKGREAMVTGAARGAGFNASKPLAVYDEDGFLRYEPASEAEKTGAAPAAQGVAAAGRMSQMNDVANASTKLRAALQAGGNETWKPEQVAKLTLAMKENDPTVFEKEISNLAASMLSGPQKDIVTWLAQMQERAMSLRNIAGIGGAGSDQTRQAILKALPGITSGSMEMAMKQLDAFDNMVDNLRPGIAKVHRAGDGTPGHGAPPTAPAACGGAVMPFAEWKKAHGG